ncbi:serine hydrolase domain-containing protein [Leifsonia kafniensis]|uniref:serine hydrolase domain-containing protein n=1 Tax=Leifsonia kafniensis TaxID=475957 RepID=UPI0031E540A2
MALDAAFDAHNLHMAPAALAAVFDRTGVIAWRAAGEPRRDGSATDRHTVFRIASMSKSFLAATALSLRDEGRLELDRAITDYVPGVRFLLDGRDMSVTLRQLLTNRSGMPEDNAWGDRQLGAPREQIAALASEGFRLTAEPGERYQYSNLGMSLVGRAIEAVTDHPIEQEIATRFLEPLGLVHTRFEASDYPGGGTLAAGFRTFDEGATFADEPFVGSGALACIGGLFSTIDDIAAWAAFLASAFTDEPRRAEVLSAASRQELQRVHTMIPIGAARTHQELDAVGYGMGLVVEHDRRFGHIVQHSGGLPGFSSHMRWHTPTGLGVVVFGNSDEFLAAQLAIRCHAGVLDRIDAPAEVVRPWPEALDFAQRIDRALRADEPLAGLDNVFAENVMRDVPADVRERRLAQALDSLGPIDATQKLLSARIRSSASPADLRWIVECQRGALLCEIRLVGIRRPLVQNLEVSPIEPPPEALRL